MAIFFFFNKRQNEMKINMGAVFKGLRIPLIINKKKIFLKYGWTISSVQIFGDFNIILKYLGNQTTKQTIIILF